ncbi:hypothetical protein BgiBS90_008316 [Biomphalaria glabrata]|nr:hypothetical protein BgiBS90_008316 [Biomphalaria glabrata]
MTGNSGAVQENFETDTSKTNLITPQTQLTTQLSFPNDSEVETNQTFSNDDSSFSITDTIAAIVSAILALVFLIMIVCLIQVIKRRRQERQGNRLNRQVVHTITSQTFGANLGAYQHVPISNTFSWESVTSNQPTPLSADVVDEAESADHLSGRTSCISLSSESVLVTAILHPNPPSAGIDGSVNHHPSSYRDSSLKVDSTDWLANSSIMSAPTSIHILSNSMHNRILSDASGLTDEINSDNIDVSKVPSTSYG